MTLNEMAEVIERALSEHRARPTGSPFCKCGWRPSLSLNDTESDQQQHRVHQANVIAWRLGPTDG